MGTILICSDDNVSQAIALTASSDVSIFVIDDENRFNESFILKEIRDIEIRVEKLTAEAILVENNPLVKNPKEGLRNYLRQYDKRNNIRKACRSDC